ncbi:hypothetical protein [Cellulophaga omnivescoria]|nr:hypothetical protein [Cellulophaga omnivescoria]
MIHIKQACITNSRVGRSWVKESLRPKKNKQESTKKTTDRFKNLNKE